MNFTGERPTQESGIEASQMRYKSVVPFCISKNVLDFGCGIGHGSYYLAEYAKSVRGYDHCKEAINEAKQSYKKENLTFVDFLNKEGRKKFDIIVSVECIEHIEKTEIETTIEMFKSLAKELVITTPNGNFYHYHPQTKEERIGYHAWHYEYEELKQLFSKHYKFVEIYGSVKDPTILPLLGYVVFASNKEI